MNKIYYNWSQIEGAVLEIARQLHLDNWRPDYIVGLTRGGLVPASLLSQYTGIKMYTLNVSLRDSTVGPESNLWMAEDAYGYPRSEKYIEDENDIASILEAASDLLETGDNFKNILIIDDINDTGATLNWIKQDWPSGCMPNDTEGWEDVWHNNVRFAVLTHNQSSNFKDPDYYCWTVNKAENDCWLVYPWEEFWK